MAQPLVNEVYTVYYEDPRRRTGLTDVQLKVRKPDGTFDGLFTMSEFGTNQHEQGIYIYDYTPNVIGEYLFMINVPSTGHRNSKSIHVTELQNLNSLLAYYNGFGA